MLFHGLSSNPAGLEAKAELNPRYFGMEMGVQAVAWTLYHSVCPKLLF